MRISLDSSIRFIRGIQVVIIVILLFVAYSFILPEEARVEREIDIAAGPSLVFDQYNNLYNFSQWSPWFNSQSGTAYTIDATGHGIGAGMQWDNSDSVIGSGSLEIVTSVPYKIVSSRILIDDNESALSSVTIYNNSDNSLSRVVWTIDARLDGVLQKYIGLFLNRSLGADLEQGLISLKYLAETGNLYPGDPQ
jgi:hypothetical protein